MANNKDTGSLLTKEDLVIKKKIDLDTRLRSMRKYGLYQIEQIMYKVDGQWKTDWFYICNFCGYKIKRYSGLYFESEIRVMRIHVLDEHNGDNL